MAEANPAAADYLPPMLVRSADLDLAAGRFTEARAASERAIALERAVAEPGALSSRIGRALLVHGRALRALGEEAAARREFREAAKHLEAGFGAEHPDTREARASS